MPIEAKAHQAREIGIAIHKARCVMDRRVEEVLKKSVDMTFGQFRLLMALKHHGSLTQKHIATFHGLTEAAISRQVGLLRKKKVVTWQVNPTNRREHMLTITRTGTAMITRAMTVLNSTFDEIMAGFSRRDRKQLVDLLHRFADQCCGDSSCAPLS